MDCTTGSRPPSGLYGPIAIFLSSVIFMRRWRIEDVGPEGTDLQKPTGHRVGATRPRRSGLYGPTFHLFAERHFHEAMVH
jgi:hypothetical protein